MSSFLFLLPIFQLSLLLVFVYLFVFYFPLIPGPIDSGVKWRKRPPQLSEWRLQSASTMGHIHLSICLVAAFTVSFCIPPPPVSFSPFVSLEPPPLCPLLTGGFAWRPHPSSYYVLRGILWWPGSSRVLLRRPVHLLRRLLPRRHRAVPDASTPSFILATSCRLRVHPWRRQWRR